MRAPQGVVSHQAIWLRVTVARYELWSNAAAGASLVNKSKKAGVQARRKLAGWDTNYLTRLLHLTPLA